MTAPHSTTNGVAATTNSGLSRRAVAKALAAGSGALAETAAVAATSPSSELQQLGVELDEKFALWCAARREFEDVRPSLEAITATPEYRRIYNEAVASDNYDRWSAFLSKTEWGRASDRNSALSDECSDIIDKIDTIPARTLQDFAVKARTLLYTMCGGNHALAGPNIDRDEIDWDHLKLLEFIEQINAVAQAAS